MTTQLCDNPISWLASAIAEFPKTLLVPKGPVGPERPVGKPGAGLRSPLDLRVGGLSVEAALFRRTDRDRLTMCVML